MQTFRIVTVAGLAAAASLLASLPATADDRICRGQIGKVTVDGSVIVPTGATCKLVGTVVKGDIKVGRNANLDAARVTVEGNVQAERAKTVKVRAKSRIGGSVQMKYVGGATVAASTVKGDVQYEESVGVLTVSAATVDGNVQVVKNRATIALIGNDVLGDMQVFTNRGKARIERNQIEQNLQCKENSPAPTGSGNVVGGDKEDQCARL